MGRARGQKTRDKNKATLPQVPKNMKSDGLDVEYSNELADLQDREAVARSNAADKRVKAKQKRK
ncbi:YfhD family protein [Bacillus andreraoultii]|uniref:YfhD family protein n=1 Tax=Bacillus andreraoultii TaxID=1499685 RepID=UPI00053AF613|nr:YfhD family protein [Bacillus andreraoultii]